MSALRRDHHRHRRRRRHPGAPPGALGQADPAARARRLAAARAAELARRKEVFVENRYVSPDTWHYPDGDEFEPEVHYCVGGATKLLRRRAVPAAQGGFRRAAAPRRDLARVADRLRRHRALLHPGRAALPGARRARRGSDRTPGERALPVSGRLATSRGSSSCQTTSRSARSSSRSTPPAGSCSTSPTCPTARACGARTATAFRASCTPSPTPR